MLALSQSPYASNKPKLGAVVVDKRIGRIHFSGGNCPNCTFKLLYTHEERRQIAAQARQGDKSLRYLIARRLIGGGVIDD